MQKLKPLFWLILSIFYTCHGVDLCEHTELTRILHSMVQSHSSISSLHSIGFSAQGRELWVMTLGERVDLRPMLRPQIKLVGNVNGYSGPACFTLVKLAQELLEGYEKRGSTENTILQNVEVQILFNMNPDGYAISQKGSCSDSTGSKNGNQVKLNRDFPKVFHLYDEMEEEVRQNETKAVMKWTLENNFILSLSLISGHTMAYFPFDDNLDPAGMAGSHSTPDNDLFEAYASLYAKMIGWKEDWNCPNLNRIFHQGWINGAEWYSVTGSMMDWNYVRGGTPEITIGVSCCRNADDEDVLSHIWQTHKRGLYKLLLEAGTSGVRGVVKSGSLVDLEGVWLTRINNDMVPVPWLTSQQGEFWRLLPPGQHIIEVSREGYATDRIEFEVRSGEPTVLTIMLFAEDHVWNLEIEDEPGHGTSETYTPTVNISTDSTRFTTPSPPSLNQGQKKEVRSNKTFVSNFHKGLDTMFSILVPSSSPGPCKTSSLLVVSFIMAVCSW